MKGRLTRAAAICVSSADAENRYVYVYYCDHSRIDNRGVQICMARCPMEDAERTDRWRKYYHGAFDEPGLGGKDTPVMSAQAMGADAIFPQVTFVPELRRYVMVFSIIVYRELGPGCKPEQSGIYIACSQDGIHWSKPTQLIRIHSVPAGLGKEVGWHPALLLSTVEGGSAKGWLYYSYSERWGHKPPQKPHYLVGQPITFSIVGEVVIDGRVELAYFSNVRVLEHTVWLLVPLCVLSGRAAAGEMQWMRVADDRRSFVLNKHSTAFVPWGFNYDHDESGRLLDDYWEKRSAQGRGRFPGDEATWGQCGVEHSISRLASS